MKKKFRIWWKQLQIELVWLWRMQKVSMVLGLIESWIVEGKNVFVLNKIFES